jgi:hypothetical protein
MWGMNHEVEYGSSVSVSCMEHGANNASAYMEKSRRYRPCGHVTNGSNISCFCHDLKKALFLYITWHIQVNRLSKYIYFMRHPLWSSGQRSWLQIQKSGFDSQRYHVFWEVVGLEQGPLSLVNTIEELLERKSRGCGVESREYGLRDLSRWPRGTSVGKSWHLLRLQAAVARSVYFSRGLRSLSLVLVYICDICHFEQ